MSHIFDNLTSLVKGFIRKEQKSTNDKYSPEFEAGIYDLLDDIPNAVINKQKS